MARWWGAQHEQVLLCGLRMLQAGSWVREKPQIFLTIHNIEIFGAFQVQE